MRLQVEGQKEATANIIGVWEPFTVSCVLLVNFDELFEGQFVVKLYDRRFGEKMRRCERAQPWNPDLEDEYREYVDAGCASEFYDLCQEKRGDTFWLGDNWPDWSKAQQEAYLQKISVDSYNVEKRAYGLLQDMQGNQIPHIFAHVSVRSSDEPNEYLDPPGFVLEYIEGYRLTELERKAPRKAWQGVCDEALQIVHAISDHGTCNQEVRPRSFVVHEMLSGPGTKEYKVFMTDFGMCLFRSDARNEKEFEFWQSDADEEGNLSVAMQQRLDGGFQYEMSSKKRELDKLKNVLPLF